MTKSTSRTRNSDDDRSSAPLRRSILGATGLSLLLLLSGVLIAQPAQAHEDCDRQGCTSYDCYAQVPPVGCGNCDDGHEGTHYWSYDGTEDGKLVAWCSSSSCPSDESLAADETRGIPVSPSGPIGDSEVAVSLQISPYLCLVPVDELGPGTAE